MDVNAITQLVGSLGFPIVCCVALFWRMIKSDAQHKEEMDKISTSLSNNTEALLKLTERLGRED